MHPFTKILVPVDFSTHSAEAIRYAADLSRRYEANVTLTYVYPPAVNAYSAGYIVPGAAELTTVIADYEKRLASAKVDAQTAGAVHVETQLLQGAPAAAITDFAAKNGYELIVMGTHGRTGAGRMVLGSVAEKVVRAASCPVLTVRAAED